MDIFNLKKETKIIIALDYSDQKLAMRLINYLDPNIFRLKIGQEMFIQFGNNFIHKIQNMGFEIFLDLKLYDIPNTVFKAVRAAADLGIWMISLHASGGVNMLKSAKKALKNFKDHPPLLIGVTVLTSLSEKELKKNGIFIPLSDYILKLSKITKISGLDGVICPGQESNRIKNTLGYDFKTIVPGIRFNNQSKNDQKMILKPENICKYNINYIIVGRSITHSDNTIQSLYNIIRYL